jgi:transposase
LRKIDEQIEKLIVTHPKWKVKAELLDSVPGVGLVLISSIIAELPELGSLNRKQVAALVGSTTIVVNQKEEDGYGVVVFIYARCST